MLRINGNRSGTGVTSAVTGGTISSTGRVGKLNQAFSGAVVRRGRTGGTLTTANLIVDASAQLLIDLVNTSASGFGKINAVGIMRLNILGGILWQSLQLAAAPEFAPSVGTVLESVTNEGTDAVSGTFVRSPQRPTVSAGSTRFTNAYTGGNGNDITLAVPKNTPVMTLSANPNLALVSMSTTLRPSLPPSAASRPLEPWRFQSRRPGVGLRSRIALGRCCILTTFGASLPTAGTQAVTATYLGDPNYLPGSPTPLSLVVASSASPFLTVNKSGSGGGTVASSPAGVSCPGDCTEVFANGTAATLTATADASRVFTGWENACADNTATRSLTITSPKALNAAFTLRIVFGNTPNIDIDGDGKYRVVTDGLMITRFTSAGVSSRQQRSYPTPWRHLRSAALPPASPVHPYSNTSTTSTPCSTLIATASSPQPTAW